MQKTTSNFIFVYITNPTKKEARRIAKHLLTRKLIACANIYMSNSLYFWKGKLADETEYVIIGKTTEGQFARIKKEVEKIHSYTIPCIIKIPVHPNETYADWVKGEVQ